MAIEKLFYPAAFEAAGSIGAATNDQRMPD
jgi:hypothetical protein